MGIIDITLSQQMFTLSHGSSRQYPYPTLSCVYFYNGSILITGGTDDYLKVWNVNSQELVTQQLFMLSIFL